MTQEQSNVEKFVMETIMDHEVVIFADEQSMEECKRTTDLIRNGIINNAEIVPNEETSQQKLDMKKDEKEVYDDDMVANIRRVQELMVLSTPTNLTKENDTESLQQQQELEKENHAQQQRFDDDDDNHCSSSCNNIDICVRQITDRTIQKELATMTKQPTMPLVWINGIFIGGKHQTIRVIQSGRFLQSPSFQQQSYKKRSSS